jgi:phosphate starvation-inducible protein PhoH
VFAGDIKQNDFTYKREQSGFGDFFKVLDKMRDFSIIEFDRNDIVRSDLVKSYIIAREELEDRGLVAAL